MCKTDHISRLLIQKNTFSSEGHLNHKTTGSSWSLPDLNMRHTHTPLNVLLCKSVVTPHLKKIPMPSQHNSAWLLPPTNRDETAGQNLKNTKKDNDWWSVVVAPLLYTSWIMLFGQSFIYSDLFFFCHVVLLGEESSQHYTNRQTPTLGYPFHTSRTTQIHPHPQREREWEREGGMRGGGGA